MSSEPIVIHLPKQGPASEVEFIAYARGERVQVCRLEVVRPHERIPMELHFAHPDRGPHDVSTIEPRGAVTVLVLPVSGSLIRARLRAEDRPLVREIAAALGVVQVAWAWDERDSLSVSVDGQEIIVTPRYRDQRMWEVQVTDDDSHLPAAV